MLRSIIEIGLALLVLCGLGFYLTALWSARDFLRSRKEPATGILPPISILKPMKGADSDTYAALRSHCLQEYGAYEVLFGVNEANDPAVPIVRRLIQEFPNLDIRLLVCTEVLGTNRKVSNLIHLLREARYAHVVVNDGDIKVAPTYLQEIAWHFNDPNVGMVTCLYRGKPAQTLGSELEALGIAADFIPGVLTARYLEGGLHFGLGSTMAMTRTGLEKIGGFAAAVDYLADDYQLGERISKAGFEVALAGEVVETSVPPYSFSEFWQHQLRWARTMRASRPAGYAGTVFTFGLPWSIFLLPLAPRSWWAWVLLIVVLFVRIAVTMTVGQKVLDDRQVASHIWLLPLRDLLGLAVWLWSFAGNEVSWRGKRFRLQQGKMSPLKEDRQVNTNEVEEVPQSQRR